MQEFVEIAKAIAGMPIGALVAIVMLAAFGLAAFAIYAVMTIAKERSDGPA
jgi:hypothetical protein